MMSTSGSWRKEASAGPAGASTPALNRRCAAPSSRGEGIPRSRLRSISARQQLTENVRQNAAVFVVEDLLRRIDAHDDREPERGPIAPIGGDDQPASGSETLGQPLGGG